MPGHSVPQTMTHPPPATLTCDLYNIDAVLYINYGKLVEVETFLLSGLKYNLASVYCTQDRLEEAKKIYLRVLEEFEKVPEEELSTLRIAIWRISTLTRIGWIKQRRCTSECSNG
ncbi:hypothetical protein T440DRAFT_452188 [Plenodomus tracheiphilus IPT5]|uniref:Uncharacterized protein n=1 Tax=Plenodomus tracheiphilus IPT5 TaxID=1408161 RepID=A0A6A7B2B6_9PLEO|nr:hypothetical protein T440DRAFT_452188 [Plenodomus tracheiphilus IPT5]